MSDPETELRDNYQKWFEEEFEYLNPYGEEAYAWYPIWKAGFQRGKEHCAKLIENSVGKVPICELAAVIRGGEVPE